MKSLTILIERILRDLGGFVGTDTTRDWETVTRRLKTEGLSFLTITLPNFAHDFEQCLGTGSISTSDFLGFKRSRTSGHLPVFLQGFVGLVFDRSSGKLLDEPLAEAIYCVRQFCLFYSKIELDVSPKRERKALLGYVECEKEMFHAEAHDERDYNPLRPVFTALFGDILSRLDRMVYDLDDRIVPKHGAGSTADSLGSNERWELRTWTSRLESIFPAWYMCVPNEKWAAEALAYRKPLLEPGAEPPVKVITVPKTMKAPRIIAMEPAHMQYVQQALRQLFYAEIERDSVTKHLIHFTDQVPNQELARLGSIDGSLATLDLSEASDRVSNVLVLNLFEQWPHLSAAIQASRTTRARVQGHGVIPLTKFASMGSALTFPIEAMVFLTVTIYSILEGKKLSFSEIREAATKLGHGMVAVYGDDIICPVEHVLAVRSNLELFGFKVNSHKSFWNGKFRESCGKEYYNGQDVSIVKWRRALPHSRLHTHELVSMVASRNLLYAFGLWQATRWVDKEIHALIGPLPLVWSSPDRPFGDGSSSSCLGRHTSILPTERDLEEVLGRNRVRWNTALQHLEVRCYVLEGKPPIDKIGDLAALNKVLIRDEATTYEEVGYSEALRVVLRPHDHFGYAGRPKASRINLRWVPVRTGT